MPDLDNLIAAIDAAEETAYGGEGDSQLQMDRALALDYYNGVNVEPAPEGRSQITDRTVYETIQWILPSLCRIFANGSNVVEFTPIGREDEQAAQQESDYLNYIVTQKNPWFLTFLTWAQDALQTKNAYCMAYYEEVLKTEEERYEGQSDESMALILQGDGVEVLEREDYPSPDGAQEPVIDPTTGQPAVQIVGMDPMGQPITQPVMQPRMLHNLTIVRAKPQKKLCFKVLPPERCKVSEATPSFSLEECDYFEYFDYPTISSLRAMGFEVPDDIASDEEADTEEDSARDQYGERDTLEYNPIDPAMKRVRFRTIWIRHDYDEDGIAELQKVYRVGREILKYSKGRYREGLARETTSRIPVACIVPTIRTHRHIGDSIADQVADIQRIKTFILRGGLDSFHLAMNPRHGVTKQVNLDDMLISQPGGVVQIDSELPDAQGHIVPIQTTNVFPDAIGALEYMERVAEGRSGVSRAFSGVDPGSLSVGGNKSSGVAINQLSTMASQKVEQIARIMAFGVEYLFSVAHELILKHGHQAETVKLRGNWVTVDPSTWKTRRDMKIVVGYGAGNKDALVQRLVMIANFQKEALLGGLPIVQPKNVYQTALELTKASDFTAPERFFTDPDTVQPPPPQPTEAEIYAKVETDKLASAERTKVAELDSQERVKSEEIAQKDRHDRLQAEVQIAIKQMEGGQQVDVERLKGALKIDSERAKVEPVEKGNQKLDALAKSHEVTKQELGKMLTDFMQRIESFAARLDESSNAPREVVRGPDGRVAGVKIGSKVRQVARDKDGRVSGLQ